MKTLFIHLSDLHLETTSIVNDLSLGITRCIQDAVNECDNSFVVFSGDMSFNGSKECLNAFKAIIEQIKDYIKQKTSKDVEVILVPGNHDIVLPDPDNNQYFIDKIKDRKELDTKSNDSVKQCLEAINVCQSFGNFIDNPFVSIREFAFDGVTYRFLLLNTAPLSWRTKLDKEHHHLPSCVLPLIPRQNGFGEKTIEIVVCHHRHDWFDYDSQTAISNYIDNHASIVFSGHDHRPKAFNSISSRNVFSSEAGVLKIVGNSIKGSFQTLVLDDEKRTIQGKRFVCGDSDQVYSLDESQCFENKISYSELFPFRSGFEESFFRTPLKSNQGTMLDLFEMPDFYSNANGENITGIESVIKKLLRDKEMFLLGSSRSGKTATLKYLFNRLRYEGLPLFVSVKGERSRLSPRVAEKLAFEDIYGTDEKIRKEFEALPKEERIALVDNFSSLENDQRKNEWFSYFKDNYGIVIFSIASSYNPKDRILEDTFIDPEHRYQLLGLTAKKRENLAFKIGKIKGIEERYFVDLFNATERALKSSSLLDYTDPEDLILALEEIADKKLYLERNTSGVFTEIFTYSIDTSIVGASSLERLEDAKLVISLIAFEVITSKQNYDVTKEIIEKKTRFCSDKFDSFNLTSERVETILLDSGIAYRKSDGVFRFRRNAFLSYFAALEYQRLFNDDVTEPIEVLLSETDHGLNGDILLFLCFVMKNKKMFLKIMDVLNGEFSSYEPLSISKKNNWLLDEDKNYIGKPKQKSHEQRIDELDKTEQKNLPEAATKEEKMLEKTSDDSVSRIEKCFRLLEILFKAVSGFKMSFDKIQRKEILDSAINAERRMLQYVFDYSNTDYVAEDKAFSEYKQRQIERHQEWSPNKKKAFLDLSLKSYYRSLLFDTIYMSEIAFSSMAASSVSLPIISALDNEDYQNCLFKLGSYLHVNNDDKFIEQLSFSVDYFGKEWQKSFSERIAYMYISINGPGYKIEAKINDTVNSDNNSDKRRKMIDAKTKFYRSKAQGGSKN